MKKTINAIEFCKEFNASILTGTYDIAENGIGYIATGDFDVKVVAVDDINEYEFIIQNVGVSKNGLVPPTFYAEKVVTAYSYGCCDVLRSELA